MKAVLCLGGNLGDREQNLAAALDGLEQLPGTQILALSNVYETEPFDVTDSQDNYLNCCALLETALSPEELLDRSGKEKSSVCWVRTVPESQLLF